MYSGIENASGGQGEEFHSSEALVLPADSDPTVEVHESRAKEHRERATELRKAGRVDEALRHEWEILVEDGFAEMARGRIRLEHAWMAGGWQKGSAWEEALGAAAELKRLEKEFREGNVMGMPVESMNAEQRLAYSRRKSVVTIARRLSRDADALAYLGSELTFQKTREKREEKVVEFEEYARETGPGTNVFIAEMARRWWNEIGSKEQEKTPENDVPQ